MSPKAFKSFIIRKKGMIHHPNTLGQHLRNQRLIQGLRQEDVGGQLGTLREVYERWERDERLPVISEWPGILSFLGYYPAREETAADLVLKARRCLGTDQKSLAKVVGVIHQRVRRWERGQELPPIDAIARLTRLASLPQCSFAKDAHLTQAIDKQYLAVV
ncbi:MAG: helix-turn-helix domain-containing protein [Bacteroidetes bacterium]|nr:helix-turn-helix domain-containing protein [Bacteroidota bacterium]